jgi:type VI protein secretion system component Hcp
MPIYVSFSLPVGSYCEAISASLGASTSPTAGGIQRIAQARDLYFSKQQDEISPKLFLAGAKGSHFPWVWVELYKKSAGLPYLTYKLTDVIIASFQFSENYNYNIKQIETISLDFADVKVEYR